MKRIVQNLLAVFLLAVLLVPVTALGEDGTVTECSNCNSTNIYVTRKNWYNGKHRCVYKCSDCKNETYGSYVPCDVTMPTGCTETATCPTCGHKYTGTTHNMPDEVSWTWNNADGKNMASVTGTAKCIDCGKTIEKTRYSIAYKITTKPTCQLNQEVTYAPQDGVTLGGRRYSPSFTVEIPNTKTDHFPIRDKGKPATCTEDGLTEGSHCYYCNKVLEAQEAVPASGHLDVYASKLEQAATCTQDGWTKETKCKNCGQTVQERERIPAPGHKEVTDAAVAPTCTKNGLTEGSHCSKCGWVKQAQKPISAIGHAVEKKAETVWEWNIPADGSFASVKVSAQCKNCNDTISTTANNATYWHSINATCTESGKNVYSVTVLLGGQEFYGEKEVNNPNDPARGHTEVTDAAVAPTCTETGKTEGKHCSVCNTVLKAQEVIPATGHTVVTDAAVAPTCTETGKTEGKHCSVCNKILVMQEEIPADGHEWGEWFVTEAAKESESGKEMRVCRRDSSHTQTREIPALGNESNAPRLHVLDKQNADRFFETTQQGSTLRVVSEYDEVTVLTGTSEILNKLLEQGIQILEFVTPQGTVRVAVKPLLNAMGSNGKFELSVTKQGATLYVNRELRNELLL